jgi:hypothetical protein
MGFEILESVAAIEETEYTKPQINVGCLFDITTGCYQFGQYGESVLNGGVGLLTGIVGIGNNYKSTLMHYLTLTAASRFEFTKIYTYDTEMNIAKPRLERLASFVKTGWNSIVRKGTWSVSDRQNYFGNEWYEKFKDFLEDKIKNNKKFTRDTPFLNADDVSLMQWIIPTFAQIDSFSEFETEDVGKMNDENELGDKGALTIHMKQGLAKIRFLSDVLKRLAKAGNPLFLTAHIGKDIPMDAHAAPVKKLQFLKNGDKVKGATDKFFFLTTFSVQCQNAVSFLNDTTKAPEYPTDSEENKSKGSTDLMLITVSMLRNKNGQTGFTIPVLVSQREGILASLSEFHYCKIQDRYGLTGNLQNYQLALRPEVALSRTTVRGKLSGDPLLARAMNITSEMCQMKNHWHLDRQLLCTPEELYTDLKAMGYDWEVLLSTRGWWTLNNDDPSHALPFLTTMDLLRMRKGLYHPYWLAEDKKTRVDIKGKSVRKTFEDLMAKLKNSPKETA